MAQWVRAPLKSLIPMGLFWMPVLFRSIDQSFPTGFAERADFQALRQRFDDEGVRPSAMTGVD
jgi:hypothetical protein